MEEVIYKFLTRHKDWFSQSDSETDQASIATSFHTLNGRLCTSAQSPGGMGERLKEEKVKEARSLLSISPPEQKFGCYSETDLSHSGLDKKYFCIGKNCGSNILEFLMLLLQAKTSSGNGEEGRVIQYMRGK